MTKLITLFAACAAIVLAAAPAAAQSGEVLQPALRPGEYRIIDSGPPTLQPAFRLDSTPTGLPQQSSSTPPQQSWGSNPLSGRQESTVSAGQSMAGTSVGQLVGEVAAYVNEVTDFLRVTNVDLSRTTAAEVLQKRIRAVELELQLEQFLSRRDLAPNAALLALDAKSVLFQQAILPLQKLQEKLRNSGG